jgi:hypothetical protein
MQSEPDGLYEKYRVFKEPTSVLIDEVLGHPVGMECTYDNPAVAGGRLYAEELHQFFFVLKPDSDYHARVAIAAYAESVERDKPALAQDLRDVLTRWHGDSLSSPTESG